MAPTAKRVNGTDEKKGEAQRQKKTAKAASWSAKDIERSRASFVFRFGEASTQWPMPVSPWGMASKARWLRTAVRKTGISPPGTTLARAMPATMWTGENKGSASSFREGADKSTDAGGINLSRSF